MSTEKANSNSKPLNAVERLFDRANGAADDFAHEADGKSFENGRVFASLSAEGEVADGASSESRVEEEARFVSAIWRLGRQDGGIGQLQADGEAVLTSKAELDWIERRSQAQAALCAKEAELQQCKERKADLDKDIATLRAQRWKHSDDPLLPPARTFGFIGPLYLCLGVLAFLAELPLAINLIDQGLRMKDAAVELESLGKQSAFALAVVLCILGMAAKISYDNWVHLFEGSPEDRHGPEVKRIARHKRVASALFLVLNVALLGCCAFSINSIAHLRGLVETESRLDSTRNRNPQEETELRDVRSKRATAGDQTFFWLTVTLPLFGAVCWIGGTTALKRNLQDRRTHRALQQAEQALGKCRIKTAVLAHEVESGKARLKDETGEEGIKNALLNTRLEVFRHGYQRGNILPAEDVASASMYSLHLLALKRSMYRQLRKSAVRSISRHV